MLSQLTNWGQLPTLYPAFLLGYVLSKYRIYLDCNMGTVISLSLLIWIIYIESNSYNWVANLPFKLPMQTRIMEIAGKLSGALFFFGVFSILFHNENKSKFVLKICRWGQLTMGIYILQTFILERGLSSIINFDGVNPVIFCFIITPILAFSIMGICIVITRLIQQNRYLAFCLLGEKLQLQKNNA